MRRDIAGNSAIRSDPPRNGAGQTVLSLIDHYERLDTS